MIPVRFERHQFFSGNGIAVAAMCAVLHEYRHAGDRKGGEAVEAPWKVSVSQDRMCDEVCDVK